MTRREPGVASHRPAGTEPDLGAAFHKDDEREQAAVARLPAEEGLQYDAITLDTNAFHKNGYALERGLLGQLAQFRTGSCQLILSEIVLRETHRHMVARAKEAGDALANAIRRAVDNALFVPSDVAKLEALQVGAIGAEGATKQRLEAFFDSTGAITISAAGTSMKELLTRYFAPSPPFEANEKKKHEFPDAIALLSMEQWAKKNRKRVLAISDDGGWSEFAKTSKWIAVDGDLASALQRFQKHADQARATVLRFLGDLATNAAPEQLKAFERMVADEVSATRVSPTATSEYSLEHDQVVLEFHGLKFIVERDDYDVQVVRTGRQKIVARVGVRIRATAFCGFSLSIWDSVDGDHVPQGHVILTRGADFNAGALMTLQGKFYKNGPVDRISGMELIDGIKVLDFGEIDFGNSPYEDDGYAYHPPEFDDEPSEPDDEPSEPDDEPSEPDDEPSESSAGSR